VTALFQYRLALSFRLRMATSRELGVPIAIVRGDDSRWRCGACLSQLPRGVAHAPDTTRSARDADRELHSFAAPEFADMAFYEAHAVALPNMVCVLNGSHLWAA
jgi:hypothetical protein